MTGVQTCALPIFDHPFNEVGGSFVFRIAETQRIEIRNRARAHREDVAQYAADAGRRALYRLYVGRVVVRLHLEDRRQPAAYIDNPRVLARRTLQLRPGTRRHLQPEDRTALWSGWCGL